MLLTVPHESMFGMFFVRFVHVLPPLRVICTWPSFVPAQIVPASFGDSAMAKTTPAYSTPMLSPVRPPHFPCSPLAYLVRRRVAGFDAFFAARALCALRGS